jgi:hypothetical protein
MKPEIVMAMYKPKAGQDQALRAVMAKHIPALRRRGLITDRPAITVRAEDGTYIEIFEWVSHDAAVAAHRDPEIGKLWDEMGPIAEYPTLASLAEARRQFPHFTPIAI